MEGKRPEVEIILSHMLNKLAARLISVQAFCGLIFDLLKKSQTERECKCVGVKI